MLKNDEILSSFQPMQVKHEVILQRGRALKQEKLIEHFISENHSRIYCDIKVQIIDHHHPNNQQSRDF